MSDFIPQDPDDIKTFDALLAEYNTVQGCELKFFFDDHPYDIDFTINNEYTADGYDVWVMRSTNEGICLCDNVYYNQPDADDVLRELEYAEECNIYCELEQYEIEAALRDRLYTNYDNYKTNLEDEKTNNEMRPLPKWFDGEVYTEGGTARNPYTGDVAELNANELAMYDLILGAESLGAYRVMQQGLGWFRLANPEAYMVLLD